MPESNKCDTHTKEIIEIRTAFIEYKKTTNTLLDEILEKIKEISKPQFTSQQITLILISAIAYMVSIMLYVSTIKSDIKVNQVRIENSDNRDEVINIKLDKLLQDVAVLNSKQIKQ